MFCKKCGAKLAENSKFCTSCGNSIEDVKTTTNDKKPAVQASNNAKLYKILAYIGFLFVIGMCVQEKDDKSVRFHVGQGILAFIVNIAITLINNLIVFNIFKTETWFGITEVSGTGYLIAGILTIAGLIFNVLGIVNVCQDKDEELPIIGKYAFYK